MTTMKAQAQKRTMIGPAGGERWRVGLLLMARLGAVGTRHGASDSSGLCYVLVLEGMNAIPESMQIIPSI
jgi:hypothetical protein